MNTKARGVAMASILVGLVLVGVGVAYLVDGLQEGAPGGQGVNPETGEPDPAHDGGRGEAGSTGDILLGSALLAEGLALCAAPAIIRGGKGLRAIQA